MTIFGQLFCITQFIQYYVANKKFAKTDGRNFSVRTEGSFDQR